MSSDQNPGGIPIPHEIVRKESISRVLWGTRAEIWRYLMVHVSPIGRTICSNLERCVLANLPPPAAGLEKSKILFNSLSVQQCGVEYVLPKGVQQGQTESGGIVLAVICWAPSAHRRCYPTGRCTYRPSVIIDCQ
jgi:hypothetical protein